MKKILLIIITVIVIILLSKFIKNVLYRNVKILFDYPRDAKKQLIINSSMLRPTTNEGVSWTLSFWIYVDDWNYLYDSPKRVIHWGENGFIWFSKKRNDLNIQIPIENRSNSTENIRFKSFPIQKWVHCCVILENRFVDLWLNGKLYHSKKLSTVPRFDYSKNMYVTPSFGKDKGYSGYISRFRYYNIPIRKSTILSLYRDGPINRNPIMNIFNKIKGLVGSIKFNVKVDVDVNT